MSALIWITTASIVLLLCLSAFFSGSETALTAVSRARMRQLEKAGDRRAKAVGWLIGDRERLIGALLLGNNLVNILAASLATSLFLALFGQAGVAYATIVMTAVVLIFSEVLPKTLAIGDPDRFSRAVAPFVTPVVAVLSPFVAAVQWVIGAILRAVGAPAPGRSAFSAAEEIRGQVDLLHSEGGVVKEDRDRLSGLLDLGELQIAEIMVHRTRMRAVDGAGTPDRIIAEALSTPYSRLPVWREEPENIVGVLHLKDVLRALQSVGGDVNRLDIAEIMAEPWFVPETTVVAAQLNAFLKRQMHLALVVDEYGAVQGLITLEDIIEEIVGEIADEHDVSHQGIRSRADGSVDVDGTVTVRELNRAMDWNLPDDEATTIAGLVMHEAGVIPEEGRSYDLRGYRVLVVRRSSNRLRVLRIARIANDEEDG